MSDVTQAGVSSAAPGVPSSATASMLARSG